MKLKFFIRPGLVSLILASPLGAQITPKFLYSGSSTGSINISSGTKTIIRSGVHPDTTAVIGGSQFTHAVGVTGVASESRAGPVGPYTISMNLSCNVAGGVSYGHMHFKGSGNIGTDGQYFTNGSATQPASAYATERATAEAGLVLTYNDVIHIESATLPAGSAVVVVRFSLKTYVAEVKKVSTAPVQVSYPPTGPGFPATSAYELIATPSSSPGPRTSEARVVSYQPGVVFPSLDDKFLVSLPEGEHTVDVNAVVGGKLTINHSGSFAIGASTNIGIYQFTAYSSSYSDFYGHPLTNGVTLRSESGHSYGPRSGEAALLQAYTLQDSLILTAPVGVIFQKATITPAGFDWTDLTETRMLVVPFTEQKAFFRARTP